MKKLFASLLAISMLASLASCGGSGTTPAPDSTGDTTTPDTTDTTTDDSASTGGDVTITFMGWEASALETQAVQNGIAKFEEQNPGIKVSYTPTGGNDDYNAKLMASAVSGSAPDTFFCGDGSYRQYAKSGILLDITDRFDENFALDDFIDSCQRIMSIDGQVYGISSCTVDPIVYYNKDIFDELGVPYPDSSKPWSIEEFREVAKSLTTDEIYGVYGLESYAITWDAFLRSAGGKPYNDDYTKSALLDDSGAAAKRVLETIKAIRVEDGSAPTASTLENSGMSANQMLQTGKVAMLVDGSWALQELSTLGFNIGITRLPNFGEDITTSGAHLHAISATTKYPDQAWEFLKFLSGVDYQGQLCKEGLWLPNRKSLWEDIDSWYDDERLGGDYKNMVEYLQNAVERSNTMQLDAACADILTEELDYFYKEDKDVEQVIQDIVSRQDASIAEAKAE